MTPVEWIVVGSFAILIGLIVLAVVCALVLAGRADRVIEAHEYADPFDGVDATVFEWPVAAPRARVIEGPWRARDREGGAA
jgi:hypothetical protein